jgi:peptide/nickel transport system permease protein
LAPCSAGSSSPSRSSAFPASGQLAWQSVTTQDLPVIIGTVLVASAFIVVANLLVDLGYALLDPRVRPS